MSTRSDGYRKSGGITPRTSYGSPLSVSGGADDRRIATELALPEAPGEDHDLVVAAPDHLVLPGQATPGRRHARRWGRSPA